MKKSLLCFLAAVFAWGTAASAADFRTLLNGEWEYGFNREYTGVTQVPGVAVDPTKNTDQKLWYRRSVTLPAGDWKRASLELYGARFLPEVYVDGQLVSKRNGGMALTVHPLESPAVRPGSKVVIEIALAPLSNVPMTDASFIPETDQKRSNVASCLWDDVVLHTDGGGRITKVLPYCDTESKTVTLKYTLEGIGDKVAFSVLDASGKVLLKGEGKDGACTLDYDDVLGEWSPENPNLYTLRAELKRGSKNIDVLEQNLGIKSFECKYKKFFLNGSPCTLRGGTVVWHRWVRDAEGRDVGFDADWFRDNVILRLKAHGANYLRFHLGVPPQRLLDLCDRYGLLVQYEWSFFHGMPASRESLEEQYPVWFDVGMKHPSTAVYHPYNETSGPELKTAWSVLDALTPNYPPVVLEDRDVLHIHKYWWSMFENLGLYYDNANQFPKAIIVDEFGGNYLDGQGNLGGYSSLKESSLRFTGRNSTPEMRLSHLAQSCARVAEYWRRIGAAGFSPFTIAGSWEDGNTWFMGRLRDGQPKSVWDDMTAAWSPVAASIDLWDRDFTPGQRITIPVNLYNETHVPRAIMASVAVADSTGRTITSEIINRRLLPYTVETMEMDVLMPDVPGGYFVQATLQNPPAELVKRPVVSRWDVRVLEAKVPAKVAGIVVDIPQYESELRDFAAAHGLTVATDPAKARILLTGQKTWERIASGDKAAGEQVRSAINRGTSVVMLDVGERSLGRSYPTGSADDGGPLQGARRITDPTVTNYTLFDGFSLTFTETAEAESHLHPAATSDALWASMPVRYTWLWNGLRGGLVVPAADMELHGLSTEAFLSQWKARGADPTLIASGSYYAYELYGFYEFSTSGDDRAEAQKTLRAKVEFLVTDAPALEGAINVKTPVKVTDLAGEYKASANGVAKNFTALASAGKSLTRTPVVMVDFGTGKGRLVLSQLLTAGRLAPGYGEKGKWGIRYDEAAVQTTLNMMAEAAQ